MYFWLRRIHTAVGVILPAGFIALYLVPMSSLACGTRPAVRHPAACAFLGLVLLVLFLFHSAMASLAMYGSSMNLISYGFYGNWAYALRRLAGIVIIPFAAYHIYMFGLAGRGLTSDRIRDIMSSSWAHAFYIAGALALIFYMMSSVLCFLFEWGVTVTERSRNIASAVAWCASIAIAAWCARMVLML